MSRGVPILGTITRECRVWENRGEIIFHCPDPGTEPADTENVRVSGISGGYSEKSKDHEYLSGDLPVGGLREIKGRELELLEKTLKEKPPVREVFRGGKPVKNPGKYRTPGKKKKS